MNKDETLLAEIRHLHALDDDRAISMVYYAYYDRLYAFALSFVRSKPIAEEVVEDVLIKFWANRSVIDAINNLRVYLYTAVKNQSLNYLEKSQRTVLTDSIGADFADVEASSVSPLEHLILSEMTQALQVVVDGLPPRCRMIFKLVREEGFKYKEVAEILDISVNTIDNQMALAVKRICAALQIRKSTKFRFSS